MLQLLEVHCTMFSGWGRGRHAPKDNVYIHETCSCLQLIEYQCPIFLWHLHNKYNASTYIQLYNVLGEKTEGPGVTQIHAC